MRLDQLPDPVKHALAQTAPLAEVRGITREERVGGDVYTIAVRNDNNVGDVVIDSHGKIVSDNRRNFADLAVPRPIVDDEQVTGIPFNHVPVAIQDAVKAYATASDVRSIVLGTDKDGRAVYDVIFYRDGRRDRLIVAKDGTVRRLEQNVSPALEIPDPNKQPVIAIGDLPQSVQDTIRRQTDNVLIKDVGTTRIGNETVYQVHYQTNGAPVELLVATDGRVVLPEGSPKADNSNAPLPAPVTKEDAVNAKVVKPNAPAGLKSVGTGSSASAETGTHNSTPTTTSDKPETRVNLNDVPVPVQNTARKLAGTATIDSISPKLSDSGVAYEVAFLQNGTRRTITINKDGVVVKE